MYPILVMLLDKGFNLKVLFEHLEYFSNIKLCGGFVGGVLNIVKDFCTCNMI
jgi:hypothetical protein